MFITVDYYDLETYNLLFNKLTAEDYDYMEKTKENIGIFLFKHWNRIINSLPAHYYQQYYLQPNQSSRNNWFKKYLDQPTKDISLMPECL
jgi:hypothetical protein